ncbi:hypothetical protein [Thioalkalivibrio thiocyanodenitrificans]|uniref:hypothetical protein n=1 Tax=Thioalkalivibrio thiocyanodenitrificans TaxID=243063 RepID=UPI00037FACFA|nr:hypothetical protein [Thioalkalivibrio thiocyanodenitrificans]
MNHPQVKLDTARLLGFRLQGAFTVRDNGVKRGSRGGDITVKLGSKIGNGKVGVKPGR